MKYLITFLCVAILLSGCSRPRKAPVFHEPIIIEINGNQRPAYTAKEAKTRRYCAIHEVPFSYRLIKLRPASVNFDSKFDFILHKTLPFAPNCIQVDPATIIKSEEYDGSFPVGINEYVFEYCPICEHILIEALNPK